jgi:Flp pilus assembly secretin CpaC
VASSSTKPRPKVRPAWFRTFNLNLWRGQWSARTFCVADNQTILLGGLIRAANGQTISKVPGLGGLPLLGGLLRNKQSAQERDEIVFLITPHVIYPGTAPPAK